MRANANSQTRDEVLTITSKKSPRRGNACRTIAKRIQYSEN